MGKLIVTDKIPDCDLKKVVIEYEALSLTINGDGGTGETFDLRLLLLPEIDGKPFLEWLFDRLAALLDQTEGDEQEFYRWVMLMVGFHNICPELDRQRKRRFNVKTLGTSETLCELAEMTRMTGHSRADRLIKFAGKTPTPTTRLLQEAIYVQPDLKIPFGEKHYLEFREQLLSEMRWVSGEVDWIAQEAVRDLHRQIASNRRWSPKKKAKALAKLKKMEEEDPGAGLIAGWQRAMRFLMEKALEMEDQGSGHFSDLVAKAYRLQEPVAEEVDRRNLVMLAEDAATFTDQYADCIVRNFDVEEADLLLNQAIERFEQVHQIPRAELVSVSDWPSLSAEDYTTQPEIVPSSPSSSSGPAPEESGHDLPFEWQQYAGFVAARDSDDVLEKWYMVGWITTNLVNRNECIRLLQREAEGVFQGVLDYGFKLVYRKIRHRLTYLERRIFKLMYFRQPILGFHVGAMNPVILSFFTGMDDETQLLILLVLVLKRRECEGKEDLDHELERRWRAFLRFYPHWLEIIRNEDRRSKRDKTILSKALSLERPYATDESGNELTHRDTLADHRNQPADLLQALVTSSQGKLIGWATKYCTTTQARHVTQFAAGKSETRIAEEEDISQPGVSKSIRAALKRIREGLIRDGLLEPD